MSFKIDLQVHLFKNKGISLTKVLGTMEENEIDAIGLLYYKWELETIYSLEEMKNEAKNGYIVKQRGNVISFLNNDTRELFVILGQEAKTTDGFHVLSIGATDIKLGTLREMIKEIRVNGGIAIIDHPYADFENSWADIGFSKKKLLKSICQDFQGKIALEWNGYCNKWARYLTNIAMPGKYTNVNKKVEKFGEKMGIPVVPTTDLHMKGNSSLGKIGTAYIEIPDKDIDLDDLVGSLNENILSFNFEMNKQTVPVIFFGINYGLPLLFR